MKPILYDPHYRVTQESLQHASKNLLSNTEKIAEENLSSFQIINKMETGNIDDSMQKVYIFVSRIENAKDT